MDNLFMKNYKRNMSVESDSDMSCDEEYTDRIQEMVCFAEKKDRLVKGIFRSAHILETCPEIVELCILPTGKSQDLTACIQHKLIQAYCWENDIPIVQVEESELKDLFSQQKGKSTESGNLECALVTSRQLEEDDDNFLEFEDFQMDLDDPDENIG